MKLIRESVEQVKVLTESDKISGKKHYYIEGIFMQSDRPNKNRRQYQFESLNKEADRYRSVYIDKSRAFGELGHPDSPTINLERVSHMIKELRPDGKDFYGKAKILETPYGKIVQSLLDEGAMIAVSTRGLGSLVKGSDGIDIVQDDYQLATAADIVADPSAPDAFVHGIMEGKEWMCVEGRYVECDIERAKKVIEAAPGRRLQEVAVRLFSEFMRKL
jgi:hypothetical protein